MTTIEDVAREAGVSVASVSRVISGTRSVRPKTKNAVLEAAEKLGYQKNYFASALRRRSTNTVGMVVPHIANPFFIELVERIENVIQADGFDLFLCDSRNDPAVEVRRVRALIARQVDGIVLICADEMRSRESIFAVENKIPIVTLDRSIKDIALDRIAVDNGLGIRMIVDHLASRGNRRMTFVGAEGGISTAQARLEAYQGAVAAIGGEGGDDIMLGSYSVDWGWEAGLEIADRPRLPDAVVCANDLIAVGVIRRLLSRGIRVPDDIAVTGFDDIALCRYVDPGITTVRQPIDLMAREAASILLSRIAGTHNAVVNLLVCPEIVIRQSSCNVTTVP